MSTRNIEIEKDLYALSYEGPLDPPQIPSVTWKGHTANYTEYPVNVAPLRELARAVEDVREFYISQVGSVGGWDMKTIPPFIVFEKSGVYYDPYVGVSGCFALCSQYIKRRNVVAHEYTHGILRHLNPDLGTTGEPGIIGEALACVVEAVFNSYTQKRHVVGASMDWQVGCGEGGLQLRNLSKLSGAWALAKDGSYDAQGSRHNGDRLGHAFYLAIINTHDLKPCDLMKIWLEVGASLHLEEMSVKDFAEKTYESVSGPAQDVVRAAWRVVLEDED